MGLKAYRREVSVAVDNKTAFDTAWKVNSQLRDRQDSDMSLYHLDGFVLKNTEGVPINDAYNLTSNRPKTFGDRVIGSLTDADLQIIIERPDGKTDDDCAIVEETWRNVVLPAVDAYLALQRYPALRECLASQVSIRGSLGGVIYPYEDEGELIPHIAPWDMRYSAWEIGRKGLSLAGYKMTKSKRTIESEFEHTITGDTADVIDLWTPDEHEAYIDGAFVNLAGGSAHGAGFIPVSIYECGASAWHVDKNYVKWLGESIYAAVRELFIAFNRMLSILNTLNMRAFTNGMQLKTRDGKQAVIKGNPRIDDAVNPLLPDEGYEPMPLNDVKQATILLKEILETDLLYGTLPAMEYGEMSDNETVAQITTKAAKTSSVLKPRKRAIEQFYDDAFVMFFRQVADRNLPKVMGIKGRTIEFPKKFKWTPDMIVRHKLNPISPQKDIANAALAQALTPFLDLETILERFIQIDDPTGVIKKRDIEEIERVMPQVKAYKVAVDMLQNEDEGIREQGAMVAVALGLGPQAEGDGEEGAPAGAEASVADKTIQPPQQNQSNILPRMV